ncbi:amidohydrolase [Rhodococcus opacus M213]|uniref:Amidohydrolase n=1 Tax=Rhodococcus opacus M213 TaxID=1129896 RepID=K8X8D5_RHOOP|nr:amidohydrolase [Rhodococcus opacus]EKT77758.1 amidohydrolase [Rhodococcus opacus M213]
MSIPLSNDAAQQSHWRDVYIDLHAHPELSACEYRTAGLVAHELRALGGWEVTERVGGTGVVGVLRGGPGPVVLLRADMDALPVQEDTGLDYASRVPGVMHACGHDVHVAALLAVCAQLAGAPAIDGTVLAVFQPAEETGQGARAMLDDGLFERFPTPAICLGQHVAPLPAGVVVSREGAVMAASDSIRVTLFGRGGHASTPHSAVDPLLMAASLTLRFQTLAAREASARPAPVLTTGALHAGTAANIIADDAELLLSLRTFTPASRERMLTAIRRLAEAEATAADAPKSPDIEEFNSFPLTVNTPEVTGSVLRTIAEAGMPVHRLPHPLTGSEDFGELGTAARCPSVFWHIGGMEHERFSEADLAALAAGQPPAGIPPNHSPRFAPDPASVLPAATAAMHAAATHALATERSPHAASR